MLRVDLVALEKTGSLDLERSLPPSDPLWEDSDLEWLEPVRVAVRVTLSGTGQVIVRGTLGARGRRECRRCLEEVEVTLDIPVELVWAVPDEFAEEDGEIRLLDPRAVDLELGEAVREELILASPKFVECRDDCIGLCPVCGRNRNEETCDCVQVEPDPRWDALRTLKNE